MQIELDDKMRQLLDYVKKKSSAKDDSEAVEYAIHLASANFFGDDLLSCQGTGRGDLSEQPR